MHERSSPHGRRRRGLAGGTCCRRDPRGKRSVDSAPAGTHAVAARCEGRHQSGAAWRNRGREWRRCATGNVDRAWTCSQEAVGGLVLENHRGHTSRRGASRDPGDGAQSCRTSRLDPPLRVADPACGPSAVDRRAVARRPAAPLGDRRNLEPPRRSGCGRADDSPQTGRSGCPRRSHRIGRPAVRRGDVLGAPRLGSESRPCSPIPRRLSRGISRFVARVGRRT
jgi:hypothetical protein